MDQITGESKELSSWPKGIFAITLFVDNLEAAKKFYQKVFDLPGFQLRVASSAT